MSIKPKYANPIDNPNKEDLLKTYIDYLKSNNVLNKTSYEAYFYIAKLCSLEPTQSETKIFLEKKAFKIFIQILEFLYKNVTLIDFNGKKIEKDEPKLDKDFKESIFVYVLYSINILNKTFKVIFYVLQDTIATLTQVNIMPPIYGHNAK